jgi:hypothetical protein
LVGLAEVEVEKDGLEVGEVVVLVIFRRGRELGRRGMRRD